MKNQELAQIFADIAELLEIKGENPFKVRAYQKVVPVLQSLTESIEEIYQRGELTSIPGIGKGIAEKIEEYLTSGKLKYYQELKESVPKGVVSLVTIPEVGPKTAIALYNKLGITSIDELEKAAREHKIRGLPGMGEKTEENILRGIELVRRRGTRMMLGNALPLAKEIVETLQKLKDVDHISLAGSLRRMKETVGDIDILVTSHNSTRVMEVFTHLPLVRQILAAGDTKSSVILEQGIQVDLRVVEPECFGAALHYFTGSKDHNIRIRELAVKKGLKVNEYGIFRTRDDKRIGGAEEVEVFQMVDLPYIPPELRENTGEVEVAQKGNLPCLLELSMIKGDLHVHTKWSDGLHTLEEMVEEAKKMGYRFLAVTDHSQSLKVARGVSLENLNKHLDEIARLNTQYRPFCILTGAEVDIRSNGTLDYPDEILARLDVVIGAIHTNFKQDEAVMTERIITAMKNKYVNIIAHPTGRLLSGRDPYQVNIEKILKAAAETETFLEINAYPERLDLRDVHVRRGKDLGVKITLGTDAHNKMQLHYMNFGVATARRGWMEKKDVLNTGEVEEILSLLWHKRQN